MTEERMPGATWLLIPEADNQGSYIKTQLIFHSTGTTAGARANRNYFARGNVTVESTFIVDYDGEIVQIMPADARADANGRANKRAISVEMVGTGDEPFTPAQVASAIKIAEWACSTHPIERRQIPSEAASGIGWHVMFGAPGPWTSVNGKVCPGGKRIAQVRNDVIPAVKRSAGSLRTPEPSAPALEDDDMARLISEDGRAQAATDGVRVWPVPNMPIRNALAKSGLYGPLDSNGNPMVWPVPAGTIKSMMEAEK